MDRQSSAGHQHHTCSELRIIMKVFLGHLKFEYKTNFSLCTTTARKKSHGTQRALQYLMT